MISICLLIAAIVFACWAALIDAGHADIGTYAQVLALAVALFAGSFLAARLENR